MAAPRLFIGHICLLLELHISIWAISRGRVSIQRKFTRRLQASGLAIELPTRVNATGPGIQARGAVQSQSGLGRGRALPAGPLSSPPLFLAQGSIYSGWLCALRNWDQDAGPAASTNRERDPACPALHYHVGSCLPHSSGLVVFKLQWAPDHRLAGSGVSVREEACYRGRFPDLRPREILTF